MLRGHAGQPGLAAAGLHRRRRHPPGVLQPGRRVEENWIRIQEQNQKPISVIIGNPPYNANQQNWNDNNKNREYPEIDRRIQETYIASSTAQKTKQYDMYKRFIRWASDRLADDGIIGFITNRAYIEKRQDDGFRSISLEEFDDIYVVDLGGDVRGTSGAGNVFGIMTGVAVGFFVRRTANQEEHQIHYCALDNETSGVGKLNDLANLSIETLHFESITPDSKHNWLNLSHPQFERLLPLADKQTKFAKHLSEEQAFFGLYSQGVSTNRDQWVYDFDIPNLRAKALFFSDIYNGLLEAKDESYPSTIKWSATLESCFRQGRRIVYNDSERLQALYRPFVVKHYLAEPQMNDRLTKNHYELFGQDLRLFNKVICFQGTGARRPFAALATDKIADLHLFFDGTQCLPLYRYTEQGERVSNVTQWGIDRINGHYRQEWGDDFQARAGEDGITAEEIFAYTYAVLHDPAYLHEYAVDLLREFPRLPLYPDFHHWAEMGQKLLDLHIRFESVDPYPLEHRDREDVDPTRAILLADKAKGVITLDDRTTLSGVPERAWEYRLGSRSALEWVLDQYKERKPRDPTIREKFNAYRFFRPQGAGHRPAAAGLHPQRGDDGGSGWNGAPGGRRPKLNQSQGGMCI